MTGTPDEQVLTEVPTVVHPSRQEELVAGSAALLREPPPDGLVRTELLRVD